MLQNIILSVVASVILFIILSAFFNGDLAIGLILVIFSGIIIGLLITIYKKLIEMQKNK